MHCMQNSLYQFILGTYLFVNTQLPTVAIHKYFIYIQEIITVCECVPDSYKTDADYTAVLQKWKCKAQDKLMGGFQYENQIKFMNIL